MTYQTVMFIKTISDKGRKDKKRKKRYTQMGIRVVGG